ncbi:MAG: DNA-processing protein DprA [Candidatus Symbiobacter sp.]|nr:DNA-processing protein DprA [Candidatus Symbiobacter sp.]
MADLSQAEKIDWLRLLRSDQIGPVTFLHLLERFGTARAALEALPDLARRGGKNRKLRITSTAEAEREFFAVKNFGGEMIALGESDYPPLLAEIEDAPPLITVVGHKFLLQRPGLAIVGARNASLNARHLTQSIAKDLTAAGWAVVSGLARGIDAAAHQGALAIEAGRDLATPSGGTIGVIAGGINVIYPPEHADLQHEIGERGVLVAESAFGTEPMARHFPRRNRLISGISQGLLVVEAAERSGSLITARFAAEQSREVFAVPGFPLDPRCRGSNNLLRDGAIMTESAADIFAALAQMPQSQSQRRVSESRRDSFAAPHKSAEIAADELAAGRRLILELLGPNPIAIDEIIAASGCARALVLTVLIELELDGRLERYPGHRVGLIYGD